MARRTERENMFKSWCEDNGGDFELTGNVSRCTHPEGETLKYSDSAFSGQFGDVVVPWSGQSETSDHIMYKDGRGGFRDISRDNRQTDAPESAISFLDRRDYRFVTIHMDDEGFKIVDEGEY